jgi:beta-phosphoglucomutase family hydrolase
VTDAAARLGLPSGTRACLFDLDGVLTRTAVLHAEAWKQMFDEFLAVAAPEQPEFSDRDYERYVDGKPRLAGTRDFLAARDLLLAPGEEDDPPEARTLWGLSNRKNDLVQELIRQRGVEVYPGSVSYLHAVRAAGLHAVVVTSSANAVQVIDAAGLDGMFEARVDGVVARDRSLPGKPAPDTFLAGAEAVGVSVDEAAVFEDALAGVAAGRAGGFRPVVGVDRVGQADELRANGADFVVTDLSELLQ